VKRRRLPGLLLLCAAAAGIACQSDPVPVRADVLAEGGRVFAERCSPCHGDSGNGNGPLADVLPIRPRNYHRDEFKWGTRPSEIAATVRGGRSGVMPGFEGVLSERQIQSVAYFVWSTLPPERRTWEARGLAEPAPSGQR
jgi:mono/diheme cytochrome c family protein